MKPFIINRNTWHYKLNYNFFGPDFPHLMEHYWEPDHSDFCSYWRATTLRILAIALLIAIAGGALFFLSVIVISHPWEMLIALALITSVLIFITLCHMLFRLLCKFWDWVANAPKKARPESLFAQKYRAHKAKICPMVEYEE
jgi:hypothetical protein